MAVADHDAFTVPGVALFAGEGEVARGVFQRQRDRLGQMPGRGYYPVKELGDRGAARLAQQCCVEDRVDVVVPSFERHDTPVGEDDDSFRTRRGDRLDDGDLGLGQVDGGAVETFGFVFGGETDEHDRDVAAVGGPDGVVDQRRTLIAAAQTESGRVADLLIGSGCESRDGVEGGVDAGGGDVGAAAALVAGGDREFPDHRDPRRLVQGKGVIGVSEQHRAAQREFLGQGVAGVDVDAATGGAHERAELEDAPDGVIDHGFGDPPRRDRVDDAVGAVDGSGHLQVQSRGEGCDGVADGAPVRDDHPVKTPLGFQDLADQVRVRGGGDPVDLVVRGHHHRGVAGGDHGFEGGEVDLAEGAFVDVGADLHPVGLLVVRREMLHRGADPGRFDSGGVAGAEGTGEVRVLGEVLKVPPAQG